jgi:hypothetical protein
MTTPRRHPRVGARGARPSERVEIATRHAQVIEMTLAGCTQDAIAAELGFADRSGVRYVIDKWVSESGPPHEQTAELRQRMVAQLDQLHAAYWPRALGERDPDTGAWNREPDARAADLLLKVAERKARLCGLDAQPGFGVMPITAEQIAAFLGWDGEASTIDVEAEELPTEITKGESADER